LTQHSRDTPQFYLTAPSPCPYLPGQEERKVFTHLVGERAPELNNLLTHGGFRRSQSIAYRPACERCRACVSVRVIAEEFRPTRSMRRVLDRNADVVGEMRVPVPTSEQYGVFRAYLDARHGDGGMADMTVLDYAMMVEDSHVHTRLIEYRRSAILPHERHADRTRRGASAPSPRLPLGRSRPSSTGYGEGRGEGQPQAQTRGEAPSPGAQPRADLSPHSPSKTGVNALMLGRGEDSGRREGELVAVALTDVLKDGLSMVYSFYEPEPVGRSLGTFMILDHVARARRLGLAYVYLGYWVRGSRKMDYKGRFLPQQRLAPEGWQRVER
jgi:arginyl-tRNA--protein-N-Asp/Glu arginylyltransferase